MSRIDRLRDDWTLWVFPLLYALASWRIYGDLGLLDNSRLIGGLWSDPVQQSWFLSYWLWAVTHAHFSTWTGLMDYPLGINLLDNTTFPLLGILVTPLTSLFGPVAVLGLLFRAAFFLSSLSAFFVLRRVVASRFAAGVGGLLYGFCPSIVAYGQNWMHLAFMPLPPVMLYLLYRALTDTDRAWGYGVRLGVVTILQCLIESEIALDTLLAAALTVLVLLLSRWIRRSLSREDFVRFARTTAGFAVVALIPLGLLALLILDGRSSFHGRMFALHSGAYSPFDALLPNADNPVSSLLGIKVPPYSYSTANGGYVGIPLVLAFGVVAVRLRAQSVVRAAATFAVVCWVLTLGNYLTRVNGTVTSFPLPFSLISRLPVGASLDGTRFTPFLDFGVVVVLVAGIDALIRSGRWLGARVSLGAVIALGMVLAAPGSALSSASVAPFAPSDAASPAIQPLIPTGGVVLTLPYSNGGPIESMLWQAAAGMHFKMLGGYAIRQSPPGYPAYGYPALAPLTVACLFMSGTPQSRPATCQSTLGAKRRLRAFVHQWDVSAILVQVSAGDEDTFKLLNELYHRRAHKQSIYVWATGIKPS